MFMAHTQVRTPRRIGSQSRRLRAIISERAPVASPRTTEVRPLEEFGEWGKPSRWSIPDPAFRTSIARWLALHGAGSAISPTEWQQCRAAIPGAFKQYRTLQLQARSFFLPRGEAVFEVLENPVSFPETPPEPILSNFLRGIKLYRDAPFYYLEPVVKIEGRRMTPLLRAELEAEIHLEESAVQRLLDERGWRFRVEHQAKRLAQVAGELTLTSVAVLLSGGITMARSLFTSAERLRLEMKALEPATLQSEAELRALLEEANRLDMRRAAETFSARLRKFDPIITFEVEGVHRLAGHWFYLKHEGQTVLKWHD